MSKKNGRKPGEKRRTKLSGPLGLVHAKGEFTSSRVAGKNFRSVKLTEKGGKIIFDERDLQKTVREPDGTQRYQNTTGSFGNLVTTFVQHMSVIDKAALPGKTRPELFARAKSDSHDPA